MTSHLRPSRMIWAILRGKPAIAHAFLERSKPTPSARLRPALIRDWLFADGEKIKALGKTSV